MLQAREFTVITGYRPAQNIKPTYTISPGSYTLRIRVINNTRINRRKISFDHHHTTLVKNLVGLYNLFFFSNWTIGGFYNLPVPCLSPEIVVGRKGYQANE